MAELKSCGVSAGSGGQPENAANSADNLRRMSRRVNKFRKDSHRCLVHLDLSDQSLMLSI